MPAAPVVWLLPLGTPGASPTPVITAPHGPVVSLAPGPTTTVLVPGAHQDPADLWGALVALVLVVGAIAVVRLGFRPRTRAYGAIPPRRPRRPADAGPGQEQPAVDQPPTEVPSGGSPASDTPADGG